MSDQLSISPTCLPVSRLLLTPQTRTHPGCSQRPSTSAQIQELNARIAASAAADIRYERCRRPAAPAPGADCAGSAAAPATRSVRLH